MAAYYIGLRRILRLYVSWVEEKTVSGKCCLLWAPYAHISRSAGNLYLWSRRRTITQSDFPVCAGGYTHAERHYLGSILVASYPLAHERKHEKGKHLLKKMYGKTEKKTDLHSVSTEKSPFYLPETFSSIPEDHNPFLLQLPCSCSPFFERSGSLPTSVPLLGLPLCLRVPLPLLVRWDSFFFLMPQTNHCLSQGHCTAHLAHVPAAFI